MSALTVGAMFAGYGGLEQGLERVLDVETAWVAEVDKAPSRILAHRYPDAPNLGDVTKVDWAAVEPVDVITGGSPCQDLSHAGKRAGMKAGTRSGLWASMCDAIDIIRPRLVLWENVRGALSAPADSAVEPCPICMGDGGRVSLRALGRVLGDLAELGYDAAWTGLRAADVGAPHGRWRVFVLAWPAADTAGARRGEGEDLRAGGGDASAWAWGGEPQRDGGELARPGVEPTLLPTPVSSDSNGPGAHGDGGLDLRTAVSLLPTPTARDHKGRANPPGRTRGGRLRTAGDDALSDALLPTPRATDGTKGGPNQRGSSGDLMLPSAVGRLMPTPRATRGGSGTETMYGLGAERTDETRTQGVVHVPEGGARFGQYAPAIARWEAVLGREAPAPTEPTGKGGAHRLSPRFVEWMMGLPDGWVTDVPDVSRNDALKALGNGVVPQQAAAAVRHLLAVRAVHAEAVAS